LWSGGYCLKGNGPGHHSEGLREENCDQENDCQGQ
jgi:hypothetical protein